jgi:GNAT superfamily N-acetyltransferase
MIPAASLGVALNDDAGITVTPLPLDRTGDAARLLARAFSADPILTHFLTGRQRRRIAYPAFFRALILETVEHQQVHVAWERGRLAGVVLWIPPRLATPDSALRRRAAFERALVKGLFPFRARAMYRGFEATAALHPDEPHWYLFFVGVDPGAQGRGIGRRLLLPVLRMADRDGVLCYLETPFPETHEFYRRLGFQLQPPTHPFSGAPPLWTMIRNPRAEQDHA